MKFPFINNQDAKPANIPQTSSTLEESVKLLLKRDFELAEVNDRYDKQLVEFSVMQEAILLANQIKDRRQMFEKVGNLLMSHLDYDRFFVIEQFPDGYKPLISIGFDESPFEAKFQLLQSTQVLPRLFKEQPFWLFTPSADQLSNQVIGILNVSSAAFVHLQTANFRAILGIGMNQPLEALSKDDVNFLILLVSQLNVIVDNIDNFNMLERQNEELRQLDKAKTTFLSIASHQLRTPLSVMKYALSFINKKQVGELNEKQHELVDEMSKSNTRIINLVNNLLSITRMEQGRLQLKVENVQLSQIVRSITDELKEKVVEKSIQLIVDIPDIITFDADPTFLRESIANLISNGIKYNKTGGKLVVIGRTNGQQVIITISDTGIGISQEDQGKLFNQFYRSDQAQIIDPEGIGLGLYTTRQFIRAHGGDIAVSSVPDQGTAFTIGLPLHQPAPQPVAKQTTPGVESK